MTMLYNYSAKIVQWIDGDTLDVDVDLGFHIVLRERVRVLGIDTPELHSPDPAKRAAAQVSRAMAISLCPVGMVQLIHTDKPYADDKYGRFLASITLPDGRDYATAMIQLGLAVAYDGGKKAA